MDNSIVVEDLILRRVTAVPRRRSQTLAPQTPKAFPSSLVEAALPRQDLARAGWDWW